VAADDQGILSGVAAVIDKDLASAVLAREIQADLLVISTAVDKVCLDFGKPSQRPIDSMTLAEARRYVGEGHFQEGSMLPKIEACVQFIENGGGEALITCPEVLSAALEGKTGTRITR
jgi:carbamate kinase